MESLGEAGMGNVRVDVFPILPIRVRCYVWIILNVVGFALLINYLRKLILIKNFLTPLENDANGDSCVTLGIAKSHSFRLYFDRHNPRLLIFFTY